jgi:hypothetical protein
MGFVMDKVALGKVFLRVLRFSLVNITPSCLSILIYHLRLNISAVGDRSSETLCHHIDMNMDMTSIGARLLIYIIYYVIKSKNTEIIKLQVLKELSSTRNTVFPEKLAVVQLLKKFPFFYEH